MIDVMENTVISRVIRKCRRGGRKGEALFVSKLREAKCGIPLPVSVAERIVRGSPKDLEHRLLRAVHAKRLEDVF